jgi:hypothetical protein
MADAQGGSNLLYVYDLSGGGLEQVSSWYAYPLDLGDDWRVVRANI